MTVEVLRKYCGCRLETVLDNRGHNIPPTPIHECCPYCCQEHAGYTTIVSVLCS